MWTHRHLLGIEDLSAEDIDAGLDRAEHWHELGRTQDRKASVLKGRTVINLFFEASTRTSISFEAAGKRLGADVVNVSQSGSSVSKGETLLDTARNLEAMRADAIVIRHSSSGAPDFLAKRLPCSVINAGDGTHEHPTQALLDAFTIRKAKGRLEGLVVAICADITHSRVARSNAILLGKKGAEVRFTAPRTRMPVHAETIGATVRVMPRLEAAVEGADVVMMLRIQTERLAGAMMSTTRETAAPSGSAHRCSHAPSPTRSSCTPARSTAASSSPKKWRTARTASSSTRSRRASPSAWRCSSSSSGRAARRRGRNGAP